MGGRLSVPRGPGGLAEASRIPPRSQRNRFVLNQRTIIAPLGILLLGSLFFIYSRTTIRAAKVNAQRHRDADGGTISWRNEALRRHGALEKPEERTLWGQLWARDGAGNREGKEGKGMGREGNGGREGKGVGEGVETEGMRRRRLEVNPIEEGIRKARERSGRRGAGTGEEGVE